MPPRGKPARRAAILHAARRVFTRDGYAHTKLTTIASEAGCSVGTLYTYFHDRDDLLRAVLRSTEEEMRASTSPLMHAAPPSILPSSTAPLTTSDQTDDDVSPSLDTPRRSPADRVADVNRHYVEAFQRNAGVMALLEELAVSHTEYRSERTRRSWDFIRRNQHGIERWVKTGEASLPEGTDAEMIAAALSAMVSRLSYALFVDGDLPDTPENIERMLRAVNAIWERTLELDGRIPTPPLSRDNNPSPIPEH